ncbi:MAG: phosphatidate cytidylyltransferase [Burkholderiaceae bacterium]
MLRTRIITAVCLLVVLLPAMVFEPTWIWSVASLVFVVVSGWEWRRLQLLPAGGEAGSRPNTYAVMMLAIGVAWLGLDHWEPEWGGWISTAVLIVAVVYWITVGFLSLRREVPGFGWLAGVLLFACWLALVDLRELGFLPLIAAMAIVWIADIGAYFCGKAFGRRKLAPAISPGKSWEGAIGGVFLVVVISLVAAAAPALNQTLPARLVEVTGPLLAILVLAALGALSIVGDLFESVLKRRAGVKDSGNSLPGHGGVLDRIDALIPVMPCVALLHRVLQ